MSQINENLSGANDVDSGSQQIRSSCKDYLELVAAMGRLTYKSIYIYDFVENKFEYVSNNILRLCSLTSSEIAKMNEDFFSSCIKLADQSIVTKANEVGLAFFYSVPICDRKCYTLAYNFHLISKEHNGLLINQMLTPLLLTEKGDIWKVLCSISIASDSSVGNITLYNNQSNDILKYNSESNKWIRSSKITLSDREIQILRLYAQGLTIKEISDKLNLAIDTIKFHRKKLFTKINVNNIMKALLYAIDNSLI